MKKNRENVLRHSNVLKLLIWTSILFFSQEAVEYTKSFVTSVVLGKDVVPRIGLHQLESLRHDLIYAIHKSTDPKVKYRVTQQIMDFLKKNLLIYTKNVIFNIFFL